MTRIFTEIPEFYFSPVAQFLLSGRLASLPSNQCVIVQPLGILYLLICAKHLVFQTFTSIYPDKTCFNSLAAGLLLRLCWNVGPICQNRETLDWCPRRDRHFTPRDDGRWWHRHYGEWILSLLHHTIPVFDVHNRQSVKIKICRMFSNLSVTS